MAYTIINKSSEHFNTKLWTGNGSTQSITGVGFQPDFTWGKSRSASYSVGYHILSDVVRGVTKSINSNNNSVETTSTNLFTSFDSNGFSIGSNAALNASADTSVAWNWKAGGGQGSSNTDGSINTTYTSVNTTAGFSISKYSGNTTAGATIGHGLGAVPKMVMIKNLTSNENWVVYHASLGATKHLRLNGTEAQATQAGQFNNTEPTSSLISLGDFGSVNESPGNYIAYAFAEKQGYSKIGSYKGNGNTDGTFIYTGFKPAFFLIKRSSAAETWLMYDNKRLGYNDYNNFMSPNSANSASTGHGGNGAIDILSNGIKIRSTGNGLNSSGSTYIYMAFAEAPLVGSNNVPCTAR
jgi:hypothetical protein